MNLSAAVWTVSELNRHVHTLLSNDEELSFVFVKGEVSNVKYKDGNIYFTLKDENACVSATMFENYACRLRFTLENGLSVICGARTDLWERAGKYQLRVFSAQPEGIGELALAFMQTKIKLESEGLFAAEIKRPVKPCPKTVAVVTSGTGAAIRDILRIIGSRNPMVRILVCPVTVQGEQAVNSMVSMLRTIYKRNDIDTVIIGRGGGSAEDLSCFNSEILARTIRMSPFPVISAVGHETDYTICDYVADVRASTPSDAAVQATAADVSQFKSAIDGCLDRIRNACSDIVRNRAEILETLKTRLPELYRDFCDGEAEKAEKAESSLTVSYTTLIQSLSRRVESSSDMLRAFDPFASIKRGYAVVTKDGKAVTDVSKLAGGDEIVVHMKTGKINASVTDTEPVKGDAEIVF